MQDGYKKLDILGHRNIGEHRLMSTYSSDSQPQSSYNNVTSTTLESIQERVAPRRLSTGDNRGEMTIKGIIRIVDSSTVVRMIMGYKKEEF